MPAPREVDIGDLLPRCRFPLPGSAVSCAVSGGPDSMAMMILAHAHGLAVTAVHVDHGLRPGSAADADLIRAVARPLAIEVVVHRVQVDDGPNLEARARDARFAVLPPEVLIGHTADDRAETLLINLMRGAGPRGLSAMRTDSARPILGLRRWETRALCLGLGVRTVEDESNNDPRFQRNRVRHELLPLLESISRRDPIPVLNRVADVAQDDDDFLEELASTIDPTDARALALAPAPLAHRAVRRWLSDPYPPDQATIERVLSVARGDAIACEIGGNREIRRSKQRMALRQVE